MVPTRKSWMKPTTIISTKPTGRAAARQVLTMPSAGVITQDSSSAKTKAGPTMRTRKVSVAAIATRSSNARARGGIMPTRAVIRMCSPRRSATTEPSMASQTKRIEASSSDQTSGWCSA